MTNLIVALPKPEDAEGIKNVLVRNGFRVTGVCTTGAQVVSQADGLNDGIVICGYKLADTPHLWSQARLSPAADDSLHHHPHGADQIMNLKGQERKKGAVVS